MAYLDCPKGGVFYVNNIVHQGVQDRLGKKQFALVFEAKGEAFGREVTPAWGAGSNRSAVCLEGSGVLDKKALSQIRYP
jgi:hypothetical protein